MKKLLNIGVLMLCFAAIGCSEEDEMTTAPTLRVVSAEARFTANGGTGRIEVEASNAVSATSNKEWCQVSVSGNVITLTVPETTDITGRTALISITSGNEMTQVPATQTGDALVCDMADTEFPFTGGSTIFALETVRSYTVSEPTGDWLSYEIKDGTITFTAKPAGPGVYREEVVTFKVGNYTKQTVFSQINVTGNYKIEFTTGGNRRAGECLVEATAQNDVYNLTTVGMPLDATFQAVYNNKKMTISFGQLLGEIGSYYVYLCAYTATAGTLTWNNTVQYIAPLTLSTGNILSFTFADNGTWSGYHVDGFYYGAFTGIPSSGNYKGGYGSATGIVLTNIK